MIAEPEFISVAPELRGAIAVMANGKEMKALLRSMKLRSDLLMRRFSKACMENPHAATQAGVSGIPNQLNKDFREAASLLMAIDLIRKEIEGEQILKLL